MSKPDDNFSRRAIVGLTDATSGLPMEDIARVAVFVRQRVGDDWQVPQGDLFHTGCGVYQYIAATEEDDRACETFYVMFQGERTAERDAVVESHYWSPPDSRPERRKKKFGQR